MTYDIVKHKKYLVKWISDPYNVTNLHDNKINRLNSQILSRDPSDGIISRDLHFLAKFKIASGVSKLWDGDFIGLSEIKTGVNYLYFSDTLYTRICFERNNAVDFERLSVTLAFALYIDDWKISDELALLLFEAYESSEDGAFAEFEKFILNVYLIGKGEQVKFQNLEPPYNVDLSANQTEVFVNIHSLLLERDKYLKKVDHLAYDFPGIDVFPIEFGALISIAKKIGLVDIHCDLKFIPISYWDQSYDNVDCVSDGGLFERVKTYCQQK